MRLPRLTRKKALIAAALLAAVPILAFLLRWPLFGGLVRSELQSLASDLLRADVQSADLSGSLLNGLTVRNLVLTPQEDSWFESWTVNELQVDYGLFGRGPLHLTLKVARLEIPPGDGGPAPPLHETVIDVIHALEGFRFPGKLEVTDARVILPENPEPRELHLLAGSLENDLWAVRLEDRDFGKVKLEARLNDTTGSAADLSAARGPVRSACIEIAPAEKGKRPIRTEARLEGNTFKWNGIGRLDDHGRFIAATGEMETEEGVAACRLDLVKGTAELDFDALFSIENPVTTDIHARGTAAGPLDGKAADWIYRNLKLRAEEVDWKDLRFNLVEIDSPEGTGADLPCTLSVRCGEDTFRMEGRLLNLLDQYEMEGTLHAEISDAAPYIALFDPPPPVTVREITADGDFHYGESPSFRGTLRTGSGTLFEEPFGATACSARFDGTSFVLTDLRILDSRFAPELKAEAKLAWKQDAIGVEQFRLQAGKDLLEATGNLLKNGDLDGNFRLTGPGEYLESLGVALPEDVRPLALSCELSRTGETFDFHLDLTAGENSIKGLTGTLTGGDEDRELLIHPSTVKLNGKETVSFGSLTAKLSDHALLLEPVDIAVSNPPVTTRLGLEAAWSGERVEFVLKASPFSYAGHPVSLIAAEGVWERGEESLTGDLLWGDPERDHLRLRGTFGPDHDLAIDLNLSDLAHPASHALFQTKDLHGGARLQARLTGTRDAPEIRGFFELVEFALADEPPVNVRLPVIWDDDALAIPSTVRTTPYGDATIRARVRPLTTSPWIDIGIDIPELDHDWILSHIPEQTRPWIPLGRTTACGFIRGGPEQIAIGTDVHLDIKRHDFPAPVAPLTELTGRARLTPKHLEIHHLRGRLGGGRFEATGEMDLASEEKPLEVRIEGTNLLAVDDEEVLLRVDPDVTFTWSRGKGPILSGDVKVPLLLYFREFPAAGPGSSDKREASAPGITLRPAAPEGFILPGIPELEGLHIDLTVETTGECRLENSDLGVLLKAVGRVRGTADTPAGTGRVGVRQGEVRLTTGIFIQVDEALVKLPDKPGTDPTIGFEGHVGKGTDDRISIVLSGPLARPGLTLHSTPPRSQQELLAYLAFGQFPGAMGEGAAGGVIITKLIEVMTDDWPRADRKEDLLTELNLTVKSTEESASRNAPWEMPASGGTGATLVRVEYPLSRWFSVIGESDLEGNVSGDIKLRFRFR